MEAEKVFSTVEIILMVILALVNDLGLLLAWILAAFFGISIAGIEVVNVFIFAISCGGLLCARNRLAPLAPFR